MKIGDDLIILQDMALDDDMDTPQKISKWVAFKDGNKFNSICKWKFRVVVCNSLKLVG